MAALRLPFFLLARRGAAGDSGASASSTSSGASCAAMWRSCSASCWRACAADSASVCGQQLRASTRACAARLASTGEHRHGKERVTSKKRCAHPAARAAASSRLWTPAWPAAHALAEQQPGACERARVMHTLSAWVRICRCVLCRAACARAAVASGSRRSTVAACLRHGTKYFGTSASAASASPCWTPSKRSCSDLSTASSSCNGR